MFRTLKRINHRIDFCCTYFYCYSIVKRVKDPNENNENKWRIINNEQAENVNFKVDPSTTYQQV